ncbi:MAG TPA: carboxypeptidase regulatory-like domain-containing protein [Bryobacteraceae bacterium]|nr:carboxypeptidase regulatory-like domain-containing protein [Bryobacteraceae bacterium]
MTPTLRCVVEGIGGRDFPRPRGKAVRLTFCLLAVLLVDPNPMRAQAVANATIQGVITDATGASIANAKIVATQTNTGQTQQTVSGNDGFYVLPNLPVGPYELEVSAPSFSRYVQSGIILQVGKNVEVNVQMRLGTVTQNIEVSADAAMVETHDTSISEIIDQRRIIDLPLNGRQATDLILLSGGASVPQGAAGRFITTHDYASSVAVSVSGGQENGNNYLLDGADHNDTHSNVNLPFPFPDALQEFTVQTSGVSARYGLHPYAVVNAVTKSGTNHFHGDLFEFVRNGDLNARNFFAATQDTLRRNQFGGTIGGPIRRDKLFFFNGFQATRTRTAPPQTISFVPSQAALNGDFSALESAACQSSKKAVTLIDPTNGQPFPRNFISPTRFSVPAVSLAKLIPLPSNPCGQLIYAIPNPNNENQDVFRVDWLQDSRNTVYGRFFVTDYDNPPYYTNNILTTTRSGLQERATSAVLADQFTTATFSNALHATYTRLINHRAVSQQMPNLVALGSDMYNAYPHFIDLTVANKFTVGGGSNAPAKFVRNTYQFADDVDLIRGRHHITFGLEAIAMQMDEVNVSLSNGEWTFNGSLTNDALADFLLGRPSLLSIGNPFEIALRQKYWGAYVQDDVRVSKSLNVHAGVRWEPSLPEHDTLGRGGHFSMADFLRGRKSSVYPNAPAGLMYYGDPGIPKSYANGSWLDFAPRVGLAWDPTGKGAESIRASYGIFFDTPETFTARDWGLMTPWGNSISLTAPPGGLSNPFLTYSGGDPFPTPYPPTRNSTFPLAGLYINFPLNLHHMYQQQWDFSYQLQLSVNWMISASYLGSKATHLRTSTEQNPAIYIPGASTVGNTQQRRLLNRLNPVDGAYYANITLADDGVNTNYNALRLSAQHRFSHKFTLLSVYTWSHCLQDAETYGNRNSQGANQYQNPYNRNADYGACDVDLRQNSSTSLVYETPRLGNGFTNQIVGQWRLGALFSAHTGFPFTPFTGVDNSLTGVRQDRPNVTGDPYVRNTATLVWINPSAFVANRLGTFGNAGYNSLRAPNFFDLDANVTRVFSIREHQQFQLRFEFFNALNHTNFNLPVGTLGSTFGKLLSAGDPRILQLAAKFLF